MKIVWAILYGCPRYGAGLLGTASLIIKIIDWTQSVLYAIGHRVPCMRLDTECPVCDWTQSVPCACLRRVPRVRAYAECPVCVPTQSALCACLRRVPRVRAYAERRHEKKL